MALSFEATISQFANQSLERVNRVKRASALTLFKLIIKDTVVDTGRLRGNWRTNIGFADVTTDDSAREAQALAMASGVVGQSQLKDKLVFSNNMDYAEKIEYLQSCRIHSSAGADGHSMVRRNVSKWVQIVNGVNRIER